MLSAGMNLGAIPKMPNGRHYIGGTVVYIKNGKKHREKGPAEIRRDGYKAWFWDGLRHRKNGPAVEYPNGAKEYWKEGKLIKKEH